MNIEKLDKLINSFADYLEKEDNNFGFNARAEKRKYYQAYDYNKIINMSDKEIIDYLKNLWSVMPMAVYKIYDNNGHDKFKKYLAGLLYGDEHLSIRYDRFHKNITEFKAKAMSEILCYIYPEECMIWNSKVENLFKIIGIKDIPSYADDLDFNWYTRLIGYAKLIRDKLSNKLGRYLDLLDADYFYDYVATKDINYNALDKVISSYINNLDNYFPNEIYKWEAVQHFQTNWNINSETFSKMLAYALGKSSNLLAGFNYLPYRMLIAMSEKEPDKIKEMFINLYDEKLPLSERIINFVRNSDEILYKYWDKSKHHFQDLHAISVYLSFRYPDKYYIYKSSISRIATKYLGVDLVCKDKSLTKNERDAYIYEKYLNFSDKLLDHIKDKELIFVKTKKIAENVTKYYTLYVQDLLYYLVTKYMSNKTWILSLNTDNINWDECKKNNQIRIGWSSIGDISDIYDKELIVELLEKEYPTGTSRKNDSLALFQFVHEMNIGDIVLIKNGKYNMFGYGIVKSDYVYSENNHIRSIEWKKVGDFDMSGIAPEGGFAVKTLTDITSYDNGEWAKQLINRIENSQPTDKIKEINNQNINYYWLNVNPKVWSFSNVLVGEKQSYTSINDLGHKRRIYANYEKIKVGDIIIAYESNPVKSIVGLAEVTSKKEDNSFEFKKTEHLLNTIKYSEIIDTPELKEMEYAKNAQGSLFALTEEEYKIIYEMIRETNPNKIKATNSSYDENKFNEQVFLPMKIYKDIISILNRKQNIILQGPPGVGKTYMAKKIAYSMIGEEDESKIKLIQFHQSYSYEDFVEGFRPKQESDGFELKKGIFYNFCNQAANDPNNKYFMIIDEINRGNLSKIFGELLVLIEKDKRNKTKIELAYSGIPFSVPNNIYIIGMMNTADRSLAMMDYALRRRFSFVDIPPAFESEKWNIYQKEIINDKKFDQVINMIKDINKKIADDSNLGKDYMIGHSYFSNIKNITEEELKSIVLYDILPLLREYYIDNENLYNQIEADFKGLFK